MKVFVQYKAPWESAVEKKAIDVPEGSRVEDVVKFLGINPLTVIVLREGRPLPLDDDVSEGDSLEIRLVTTRG